MRAIKEGGKSEKYKLRCGTTTADLLRLADWLHGHQVTHVAMEATGVYWKPVWHILEGQFELLLANPDTGSSPAGQENRPERWRADCRFLATRAIARQLRAAAADPAVAGSDAEPDHAQTGTGPDRQSHPEGAGRRQYKLSSVMSDVMGVSGRAMLRAMVRGESDPEALAQLARKRLRGKIPVLQQAATGTLNEHHRFRWSSGWRTGMNSPNGSPSSISA